MTTEITPVEPQDKKINVRYQGGSSDTVYGLGLLGAWAYYIGRAKTPREVVMGFIKGIFWPALLVYALLELLNKEQSP